MSHPLVPFWTTKLEFIHRLQVLHSKASTDSTAILKTLLMKSPESAASRDFLLIVGSVIHGMVCGSFQTTVSEWCEKYVNGRRFNRWRSDRLCTKRIRSALPAFKEIEEIPFACRASSLGQMIGYFLPCLPLSPHRLNGWDMSFKLRLKWFSRHRSIFYLGSAKFQVVFTCLHPCI